MKKVITHINICCLLFQYASSQYDPQVYEGIQQGYQYPYQNIAYQQYSRQNSYKKFDNNKWMQENYEDYNDYVQEICACDKCDETIRKLSCRAVCPNCFVVTPSPAIAPSYVFLPFPYPFPTAPNTTLSPVTDTVETTTISTITTQARTEIETKETRTETVKPFTPETLTPSYAQPKEIRDVFKDKSPFNIKDKGLYSITSIRRTKPHWLPKYGIVPISDKFAEKLMLQLRSMRVIHPQKDNIRNVDEITPLY